MHDALLTESVTLCDEELYNIKFCANLVTACCDVGTLCAHAEDLVLLGSIVKTK